jgi:hypothetical protein
MILWIFFCWVWEAFMNFKIATNHVLISIGYNDSIHKTSSNK